MKNWLVTILLSVLTGLTAGWFQTRAGAQPVPIPLPAPYEAPAGNSLDDFQRSLLKLRSERESLNADWNSLTRRLNIRPSTKEPDLEQLREKLDKAIIRLKQERAKQSQDSVVPPTQPIIPKSQVPTIESKRPPYEEPAPGSSNAASPQPSTAPVDILHLAQTLYRAERYDEALAAFRQVDLKGKRAEERSPILYLTANCLHQLGKTDDGIALLRDAANSRGDERFAEYSQWQIENLRWHREVRGRVEDIRQRRLATEKR